MSVETKQPTAAGGDFVIEVVYRGVMIASFIDLH